MTAGDVLDRLRAATGYAHRRLEERLDIVNRLAPPEARRSMVERFFGYHQGAEQALAPILGDVGGLDFTERLRTPLLQMDLEALGSSGIDHVRVCPVDAPGSLAEALGLLYVLEGSTLGGRVIRREMSARGQSMTGLTFLDPYGARTGERWRAFLDILRSQGAGSEEHVVRGGNSGFRHAEAWLCGGERA